jgi:hypothetical protein
VRAADLLDIKSSLEQHGIVFSYCGYLNDEILTGIGQALRTKLALQNTDKRLSRAVFSSMVEQVQNVIRYSAQVESSADGQAEIRYGFLAVGQHANGKYFVTCCNLIKQEDVQRIGEMLDSIRELNRRELTELMRAQLLRNRPEFSKGAGAGFIAIARESDGDWSYEITPTEDKEKAYFCLQAQFQSNRGTE